MARQLIRELGGRFGQLDELNSDSGGLAMIREEHEKALKLLSAELYSSDAHFLLEFVQNADDNEYAPGVVPAFSATFRGNKVLLECNEVGFSEANVRAICTISSSTKANSRKYIGEKGIGFKSVFRVADVVHIDSAGYEFKFDKRNRLGMVCPVWEEFPDLGFAREERSGHWTSFLLTLSGQAPDHAVLQKEISKLDPTVLLFLKNLKFLSMNLDQKRKWEVYREDNMGSLAGGKASAITLHTICGSSMEDSKYILVTRMIKNLPERKERMGVKETTISLAFPVTADNSPRDRMEKVYAFLPIREYGFKFIIHADFLTPANREDIHDNAWNRALRAGIIGAFMDAVHVFKEIPQLRYSWLSYVPKDTVGFFKCVEWDTICRLNSSKVFEDQRGICYQPANLFFTEDTLRRADGSFVLEYRHFCTPLLCDTYIPQNQGTSFKATLEALGVRALTWKMVCSAIKKLDPSELSAKESSWHEDLSRFILQYRKEYGWKEDMGRMRIIPTTIGSWVCANNINEPCIDDGSYKTPTDIGMFIVAADAGVGDRRLLLDAIGVPTITSHRIISSILKHHSTLTIGASPPSSNELIAHARFLYEFGGKMKLSKELDDVRAKFILLDENGRMRKARDLYMDIPNYKGRLGIKELFEGMPEINILSSQYFEDIDVRKPWIQWLKSVLGIFTRPRIELNGQLSPEFTRLTQTLPTPTLLRFLRENWSHYSKKYDTKMPINLLQQVLVTTSDGYRVKLKETYLPTTNPRDSRWNKILPLHFLDIPDPTNNWSFLRELGVTTSDSAQYYLSILSHLRAGNGPKNFSMELVSALYEHLSARFAIAEDSALIRDKFNKDKLFFAEGKWYGMVDVIWKGFTIPLPNKIALETIYPQHAQFFREGLRIKDGTRETLIDEIASFTWKPKKVNVSYCKTLRGLLVELSKDISLDTKPLEQQYRDRLQRLPLFPIITGKSQRVLSKPDGRFYVPDKTEFFDACKGQGGIDLLDVSPLDVPILEKLLSELGVAQSKHYLSHVVKTDTEPSGSSTQETSLQDRIRTKARLFARLVYHAERLKDDLVSLRILFNDIQGAEVYRVQKILCQLSLPPTNWTKSIPRDSGHSRNDGLKIYVADNVRPMELMEAKVYRELAKALGLEWKSVKAYIECKCLETEEEYLREDEISELPPDFDKEPAPVKPEKDDSKQVELQIEEKKLFETQSKVTEHIQSPPIQAPGTPVPRSATHLQTTVSPQKSYTNSITPSVSPAVPQDVERRTLPSSFEAPSVAPNITTMQPTSQQQFPFNFLSAENRVPPMYDNTQNIVHSPSSINSGIQPIPSFIPQFQYGPDADASDKQGGCMGEYMVYQHLKGMFPQFSEKNWTSELRVIASQGRISPFTGTSNADFEYHDFDGSMTAYIYGPQQRDLWQGAWPIYLIEVKSTSSPIVETPFHMSQLQVDNATRFWPRSPPGTHVFIIFRVADVFGAPILKRLVDVDSMIRNQVLLLHNSSGYTCSWTGTESINNYVN